MDDVRVGKGNHVPLRGGEEIRLALPPKKTDADMVHYIYRLAPEPPAPEGGITKHYVIGDHVGSGQFGEVKRGRCKATGYVAPALLSGAQGGGLRCMRTRSRYLPPPQHERLKLRVFSS